MKSNVLQMKLYLGVFVLLSLALFATVCEGSANVHVSESLIVDDAGRVRIYHGANFVNKGFPWYPPELLDPNNVRELAQTGVNFIRLGYAFSMGKMNIEMQLF